MGGQRQRPCHPGASSSYGKGEQLRSSQQCYARTEARTSRERLAARSSWNEGLLRIILVSGTRRMIICASNPVSSATRGGRNLLTPSFFVFPRSGRALPSVVQPGLYRNLA